MIIACAAVDPFFSVEEIRESLGQSASETLIRQPLNEGGLRSRSAPQGPVLTERLQRQQLEYAIRYRHWGAEE